MRDQIRRSEELVRVRGPAGGFCVHRDGRVGRGWGREDRTGPPSHLF